MSAKQLVRFNIRVQPNEANQLIPLMAMPANARLVGASVDAAVAGSLTAGGPGLVSLCFIGSLDHSDYPGAAEAVKILMILQDNSETNMPEPVSLSTICVKRRLLRRGEWLVANLGTHNLGGDPIPAIVNVVLDWDV